MSDEYDNSISFGDEDEGDLYVNTEEFNVKELTIYAIDCNATMMETDEHGDTPLMVTLKSIRSKVLDRVNSRPNDQVGIVLFGTTEKNNMQDKDHIYVLQQLDLIDAPRIKELDLLIDNKNLTKDQYGSANDIFPFSDLLWVCSDIIANTNVKQFTKRIIIITNNDDPTSGNANYRRTAIQRAKDLTDSGSEIVLFGLDQPDHTFDRFIFYKDIVVFSDSESNEEDQDEFNENILSSTGNLRDLFEKIKNFQTTARSAFRLPFEIGPGFTIGIRGYNMILEQKVANPKYYFAEGEQIQEVKTITRWKCVDTNEYLTPIEIKKSYSYGGQEVVFSDEEISQIMTINEPGLLNLGFRDVDWLKPHYQITHPYFIYPDESQYRGSRRAFFLLLSRMIVKGKLAICSFVRRVNAMPRLVALVPQAEKMDSMGNQIDPPGFQLITLPYADEIRQVPPHTEPRDFQEAADAFKPIIRGLTIEGGYDPMQYHNPYLVNHKNMIQRAALETEPDPVVDTTVPRYDYIESELSDVIDTFKSVVGLDTLSKEDIIDNEAQPQVKKRAAAGSSTDAATTSQSAKKIKEMTVPEHWANGTLDKVTNPSLKEFLTSVNVHPKKLKKDLIDQVDEYLKVKQE